MTFTPRPYQAAAITAGVNHFRHGKGNGVVVLPTGAGKSIVLAGIAHELGKPVVIFQPGIEIMMQNMEKMQSYGYFPTIFSASAGQKQVSEITFATIGSAANKPDLFKGFGHVIVDECHLAHGKVSTRATETGTTMYKKFLDHIGNPPMVGLSATPWRLASNSFGSENRFLTRMKGGLWNEVIHVTQIQELKAMGFMAELEYFYHQGIDPTQLVLNGSGSEYTEASVLAAMQAYDYEARVINMIERLLRYGRKSILVFTPFTKQAFAIAKFLPDVSAVVTGETPKDERARIIADFKEGRTKVVLNVAVLGIGFDHPALDTVILGAPTMSLSRYYQQIGRGLRPHPSKKSTFILDMVGTSKMFGKVEDFRVTKDFKGRYVVKSGHRQLTNAIVRKPQFA